ncbi:ATP-binding cassette subfamily C protein [Novosphingobium kunmingense]|uniref:ATP-binding cassette subfamily C protein n=1 Tax=Novosphingobium kunmingense TaxID=1211806 RepID=A0A2N0H5D9_9SPHN|nr:ABC transporter ATP-binding protein [Novosphingobium kunmingense]PKB14150.1 ATP-binding cassette subfamily C protein [Novosphingobium kunmingense]
MTEHNALRRLIAPGQRAAATGLVLLMAASALTEGLGIMLLVPLLAALQPGATGPVGIWLGRLHVDPGLGETLALFVVLIALRSAINVARGSAALRFELGVVQALRRRAWNALLDADWRTLSAMRRSDSMSLLTTEIDRTGYGINQAIQGLAVAITLAGLGIAGLAVAPLVTLIGGVGGLCVLLAYRRMRRRAAALGERLGEAHAGLQGSLGDSLAAIRTVKSLGGEARAREGAFAGFAALFGARMAYQRDMGLGQAGLQIGGALVLAGLDWIAAARWHLGPAAILPVVALFARSLPLLGALQESWQNLAHARPAMIAVFALIDRAEAAHEPDARDADAPPLARELRLDRVGVQFAGSPVPALTDIDLIVPAGRMIALTGPSGAGKSTLADVFAGLLSPDCGSLTVDGVTIDPALRRAWRRRVAYVHQDAVLAADSLRENLAWGLPVDDLAIEAALRAAAAEFALDLPEGLATRLGDGGRVLSGGERQRLALARALLRDPALLILDEATSALDADSEARIVEAIAGLKGRMTIVVIGHRGALLALADQVVKLDRGAIVAIDRRTETG